MKPNTPHDPLPADAGEDSIAHIDRLRNAKGNLKTAEIRRRMQKIMQNNAAVFRTQETLAEGCELIDEAVESFKDVKVRLLLVSANAWVCQPEWLGFDLTQVASYLLSSGLTCVTGVVWPCHFYGHGGLLRTWCTVLNNVCTLAVLYSLIAEHVMTVCKCVYQACCAAMRDTCVW